MSSPTEPAGGPLGASISKEIVRVMRDYTGRGPTKARTVISEDAVIVLLADTMTQEERMLVANGKLDHVLLTRSEIQTIMRTDAIEAIERLMGRKVIAFMSANHVGPDLAGEIFMLEPAEEVSQAA
jgi:uncharacterized protein YbcI